MKVSVAAMPQMVQNDKALHDACTTNVEPNIELVPYTNNEIGGIPEHIADKDLDHREGAARLFSFARNALDDSDERVRIRTPPRACAPPPPTTMNKERTRL